MVVLLVIVLVLYEARSLMNMILLTFIFTYLIVHWVRLVQRWIPRVPVTLVVLLSYLLLILGLFCVVKTCQEIDVWSIPAEFKMTKERI